MRSRSRLLTLLLGIGLLTPGTASAATFSPISVKGLRLVKQDFGRATTNRLKAMQRVYTPTSLLRIAYQDAPNVAGSLNPASQPAVGGASSAFAGGFVWDRTDETLATGKPWWPQGITGTADANPQGNLGGHKVLITSWYQRSSPNSTSSVSSRISVIPAESLSSVVYRHVLLVQMTGGSSFTTSPNHAGGVAWVGTYLYAADTSYGLRVYDIRHILRVPKARRGLSHTYKYILPQVGAYRTVDGNPTFSFVSVDRTTSPAALLTGEYRNGKSGGRLVRWNLAGPTGPLRAGRAAAAWSAPATNMQGALSVRGTLITASSAGDHANGRLTYGRPGGRVTTRSWAIGGEDLSFAAGTNRIYTLTEHPGLRAVFGFHAQAIGL